MWMEVPTNTSITVGCKTNLGMLDQRMPMASTPTQTVYLKEFQFQAQQL